MAFYPNLIRIRTPYQWLTYCDWDSEPGSLRGLFQQMIDLIQPDECWIGTDYATDQTGSIEVGLEQWLADVQKEYGPIGEFDFEKLYEDLKNDIWPKDLYHVKENNLYK